MALLNYFTGESLIDTAALPLLVALAALALVLIFRRKRQGQAQAPWTPYRSKPLLSAWERRMLPVLRTQVPPGFYVCPQVRLADMLSIANDLAGGGIIALNKVAAKSVDFAIIELETGRVALVVELDDRTHEAPERRNRDRFVNGVLDHAGIPIARFRPNQRIDVKRYF